MGRIAVVNTKGGVGKTTEAVHLATILARDAPTLLIDGDPQGTAASWATWRREAGLTPSPITVTLNGKAVLDEGKELVKAYTHTVIDAGGRDNSALRCALVLAEVAIVPVGASGFDTAAMTDLVGVIELARTYNPALKVRVVLSRIDPRSKKGVNRVRSFLKEYGLPAFDSVLHERVAVRLATEQGSVVHETKEDIKATAEFEAFVKEVLEEVLI